ncbi:centrosomal protein of 126 kDa [Oncorhynchus clarkii lewisi]|uniref:centrosomal protein of 126 kDa n=1 Tax=Oncorhynchus clarkii lewisi TaxID=490388 RepID=UPI0039B888F0
MKALKDNFFYSIGADGVFVDDRHVLVEEQKSCRARARCFSLETNRRRKVLEERRKLWDVQEQRLRESILQQRKQRVQDATERFQRAHLPPSQRRRQSFRKSTLNIEEALNHIQGTLTLSSYTRQSPTPDRSCTSSPKPPPTPSPSLHQGTLSALEVYSKLMQDRTFSSFKNRLLFLSQLQETQLRDRDDLQDTQLRERDKERDELQDTQLRDRDELQETQLRDWDELQGTQPRERDELQDTQPRDRDELQGTQLRDRERDMVFLNELQDTQLWDKETCSSPQERESHLRGDHRVSGVVACSKTSTPDRTLLEFTSCLIPEGKLEFRQQVRDPEDKYSKQPSATQVLLPGKTYSHKDLLCEAPSSNPDHILSYNTKSSSGVREDTANIQPTKSTHHQSHGSKPSVEDAMNNLNKGTNSEPKAESNSEPKARPNSKPKAGSNSEPKARPNSKPKAGTNSEPKARTNSEPKARPNSEPKAGSNSEPKAERSKNTDPLSQTLGHCNIRSDFPKGLKSLQVEITPTTLPDTPPSPPPVAVVSKATDHKGTEVRCIKGILKKQSKYGVSGGNACSSMYNARHLIFTKQFTMSIRDSVELTRRKGKDADKMIKKKIRWLDEVNLEEEEEMERSPITNNKCVSEYPLPPHKHSASSDHQQGQGQTVATNTPLASTGYDFTKQAWADVRVQESRVEAREVRVQRGSSGRAGCPRVPRRVRSARAGMDPVSSRSRKGTVIRPQSATEASSHVAWVTHGKVMVPRPPPRTETMEPKPHTRETDAVVSYTTKTPYNMDHSNDTTKTPYKMDPTNHTTKSPYNMDQSNSAATKAGIPVDEALCNNNTLDSFAPSQTRTHVIRADSSVISNPSKATSMSGQQDAQGEAARWGLLYHENGLCLDRTPTDEEISQLWHGVRSALATKDGDPITVLPQARANLSRVTINGDSLINGVKAITTMGDFFLSPTNGSGVMARVTIVQRPRSNWG